LANAARAPTGLQSACEPYRHIIEVAVAKGLSAQRIWQYLKVDYHFSHGYCSVKRFIRKIRLHRPAVAIVTEHTPGGEAKVDLFQGPPTLDPQSDRQRYPGPLPAPCRGDQTTRKELPNVQPKRDAE